MRISVRGFTLVEVIVVIAILGIILALLIPAISAAMSAKKSIEDNKIQNVDSRLTYDTIIIDGHKFYIFKEKVGFNLEKPFFVIENKE